VDPDVAPVSFEETGFGLSPDGRILVASRNDTAELPRVRADLVVVDLETGERRPLTDGDAWYDAPAVSPDGGTVAAIRESFGSPDEASRATLVAIDLATGTQRTLAADLDRRPEGPTWAPDGSAVFVTADDDGHHPAFRVDLADGRVTRLSASGALGDLCPTPGGDALFALRSTMGSPPRIVRLDARTADQAPRELDNGISEAGIAAPGVVERLTCRAADGTEIGSWLVRPADASAAAPAPLVVWAHGGPLGSWSGWHWRWNPHLLAARGYAVLMPDPAISTGYGQAMIQRGWGDWGAAPYTDVVAAVDAALADRADLDAGRTALMGGSFGGYMANWVAGHTDRYRAIVTHASLWELRGFHGTTDGGAYWELEMGDPYREPERYVRQSPFEHLGKIRTPMLVIHGEQDFRVPVSEALRLWTDLRRHGVEGKLLYFPDENHWILKPQNARLWYATVLAFLDEHVLGKPFERPALL
jgi:dipeptidyl aminopeptidase/acylaminoacyl peptidase